MEYSFNEDQIEMSRQARRFFENETPMDYVREMFEDERGFKDEVWTKMAEMGWMAMRIPEQYDGLGMSQVDLTVILEEMGRGVVPGPFFSTVQLAAEAIMAAGTDAQKEAVLSRIAMGEIRGTLALSEEGSGSDPGYVQLEAKADGDGFVLNGTKLFVPDAHVSDFIICAARTEPGEDPSEGITLFLVDSKEEGVSVSLLPTMDGTRKLCAVTFEEVRMGADGVLGEVNQGWIQLSRVLQRAQVGLCAECVGGARKALETAVEYAKIRIQFDQPIGAYQAIKHLCSEMFLQVESARSMLYWAAWSQDEDSAEEAAMAASVTKAYCSEVYKDVSCGAIQILGGTGFTWEHDIHFYLKRAKANEVALGDPVYHREQVARYMEKNL
jgi:alkylation response protein AidB-like acyl-CoA dehydrogenase